FLKRIPTRFGHFCCILSGKVPDTETSKVFQASSKRSWGRAAASGSTQQERIMWHLEHSTQEFRLCRNRVAVATQSPFSMAGIFQAEMSRAATRGAALRGRIERGCNEGDQ